MSRTLVAVVLAGGTGSRLYPASQTDRPKQFLSLAGEQTLLEQALDRVQFADRRYVLTREAYADTVRDIAPDVGVLTEPAPKDTGPALVYAAHRIAQQVDDPTLLCLPSDHAIGDGFRETAERAVSAAESGDDLVTIGVEPDRPATGYGYIQPASGDSRPAQHSGDSGPDQHGGKSGPGQRVEQFVEKPGPDQAEAYVEAGWYWNSGIFAWTPETLLDAAAQSELAPLVDALDAGDPAGGFKTVSPESIDNAVLETASNLAVVAGSFDWADLGSWDGLSCVLDGDDDGNVSLTTATESTGEIQTLDTRNCVLATDGRLNVIGVDNLIVASFDGHTVVLPRGESARLRELNPHQQ
jgi:mannose-1-phosphate guanylyltransferase